MSIITLQPAVLQWARNRAGLDTAMLAQKLHVAEEEVKLWEQTGNIKINLIGNLANATHTPEGFLYLSEPPQERLPVPDFRTFKDKTPPKPSPELLDTIYAMLRRQQWMREFLQQEQEKKLDFVGSISLQTSIHDAAQQMRDTLRLESGWADQVKSWHEALVFLRKKVEEIGVLVVINGVVGNHTRRKLRIEEFRGFALSDPWAPLIFINGSDFPAAQMFTLAHELVHIWIDRDGVSNLEMLTPGNQEIERFCNSVAAEFLVPESTFKTAWEKFHLYQNAFGKIAVQFKVSTIVVARKALDLGYINRKDFFEFYNNIEKEFIQKKPSGGGNFWHTQNVRIGDRFGHAIAQAVKEGKLLYQEAFRLTGLKAGTFDKYLNQLGY